MKNTFIDSTGKIQIVLESAVTTNQLQWTCSYYDKTLSGNVIVEWSYSWVTSDTTPVDILPAPASGHIRTMKNVTVYNADTITAVHVLQLVDAWGTRVLIRNTLTTLSSWSADDMSFYTDISGKLDTTALSDTAYWAWWDGDTTHTATKNAVYDKVQTLLPLAWGTMTWNITLWENTWIALDPAGSADEKWTGITCTWTAWATIAVWDLIYLDATAGEWLLADADAASTSWDVPLWLCIQAANDWQATNILLIWTMRSAAFPASIALWAPVYVSTTAGDIQAAKPSATDDVVRRVWWAITTEPNTIYFNPSNDYATIL